MAVALPLAIKAVIQNEKLEVTEQEEDQKQKSSLTTTCCSHDVLPAATYTVKNIVHQMEKCFCLSWANCWHEEDNTTEHAGLY